MDERRALLFGATIAAAIGPIALLVIHNGMRHGLAAALASATGVAAADFVYAVLAFTAGSQLAGLLAREQRMFAVAAAAVLVGLGLWLAQGVLRPPVSSAPVTPRVGFRGTFLLTLANPLTIVLFAGFSGQLALSARWADALYFAAFIFAGSLPVQTCYALFGAAAGRLAPDQRVVRTLNAASAAGIALFGVYGLARVL
jgi:threonine/homoserine/homoserine lactone efflux protein